MSAGKCVADDSAKAAVRSDEAPAVGCEADRQDPGTGTGAGWGCVWGVDLGGAEVHHSEVEIAQLHQQGADRGDEHDPGEGVVELRLALEGEDEGGGHPLDAHDGERARERADEHVDDDVAALHGVAEQEEEGEGGEDAGDEDDEARLAHVVLQHVHCELLVRRRRVDDNEHGADDGERHAGEVAPVQLLLEDVVGQHAVADYGHGTQRRDQRGGGVGVCKEVARLPERHQHQPAPPQRQLHVRSRPPGFRLVTVVRVFLEIEAR